MSRASPKTATAPKSVCEPATQTASLPLGFRQATLGELFAKRTEPGRPGLPIMSLTMDMGLIQRDSVDRRVETNLKPEHHLLVLKGDLAYNTMRMWQGVSGLAKVDCLLSPAYVVLRSLGEIAPEFAAHIFKDAATIAKFRHFAYGVVDDRLRLYFHDLRRIPVAIPESLPAQRKIATVLTTVDNLIEKTEALIAKYQSVKQGLMHDLFTRGVDEHGHLRPPYAEAPQLYKESKLGWIPREWATVELSSIANVNRGKFTARPRNDPKYYGGGHPFIQTGDVANSIGRYLTSYSQTLNELGTSVSKEFPSGTILVTIAANIADTAILGIPMYLPDSIVGVTVHAGDTVRFVELCIRQRKHYFESIAPQSAQKNINLEDLRPLLIPRPETDEQRRIADIYESLEKRLYGEWVSLAKLRTLKTALMQDLLTGKVRVKVDEAIHV